MAKPATLSELDANWMDIYQRSITIFKTERDLLKMKLSRGWISQATFDTIDPHLDTAIQIYQDKIKHLQNHN